MTLVKVAADKRHFADANGQPFFALGVNYTGYSDRAWKMWENNLFDPALITRDFRKAQQTGFNCIRLFVHVALEQDLRRDNFAKLDQTLSIAQDYQLKVMLAFNDAHGLNLGRVSDLDAKIAARYKDVPTVFAYDLENEPVFYNLVAATYPDGYQPPVQTSQLVDYYGVRVSRQEALDLQRNRKIPAHLSADNAFYYINALRLFLEYDRAVNNFINQGKGATIVDFMLSGEATPWYTLISVLDGTVEAWLRARTDPVRAVGCQQLLNVGWNWLHFAALPANRMLDFQQYHNYVEATLAGFNTNVAHLEGLRRAFPNHPIVFGEFGWSNHTSPDPATSRPTPAELTALYEAATYTYMRANSFGGAFKWVLNDLNITYNPYEANFGVFKIGDQPKPIAHVAHRFGQDLPSVDQVGSFSLVRDLETGLAYRFDLPQQVTIGGHVYQDDMISWQAGSIAAHCFIKKIGNELAIEALGPGQLSIDPWDLLPGWDRSRKTDLYQVISDRQRTRLRTFEAGESVLIETGAGVRYAIVMGAVSPVEPPDNLPEVKPNPGEHVVLLGNANEYLQAALYYIRRFSPDVTFAPSEVDGRWAYVTVVATAGQVAEAVLDNIRSVGAVVVERVVGQSPEATKARLDELANRGQRFLAAAFPSQDEPPAGPPEPPPAPKESYVVQPGDTLGKIAQKVYGEARLWTLIFEANRDKISNPSLIRVGMELLIPPKK
jgi:LysM repeat protein